MDIKKTANLLLNFTLKTISRNIWDHNFLRWHSLIYCTFFMDPDDPNFIFPKDTEIKNILGFQGSFTSDLFFQSFGFIAYLISFTYIITGINIPIKRVFFNN